MYVQKKLKFQLITEKSLPCTLSKKVFRTENNLSSFWSSFLEKNMRHLEAKKRVFSIFNGTILAVRLVMAQFWQ